MKRPTPRIQPPKRVAVFAFDATVSGPVLSHVEEVRPLLNRADRRRMAKDMMRHGTSKGGVPA